MEMGVATHRADIGQAFGHLHPRGIDQNQGARRQLVEQQLEGGHIVGAVTVHARLRAEQLGLVPGPSALIVVADDGHFFAALVHRCVVGQAGHHQCFARP